MRYSKREIEGLPTPEETVIDSLSEYIEIFSEGRFNNYLFRGEPTNYHETTASGLRDENVNHLFEMKHEFKKEVWHKLSQDERIHFTSFCQHHGIPTNLVDITTSPLIALFFACQKYEKKDEFDQQRGFVYLFEDTAVDISTIVEKYEEENILELLSSSAGEIFADMYRLIQEYGNNYFERMYKQLQMLLDENFIHEVYKYDEEIDKIVLPNPYNLSDFMEIMIEDIGLNNYHSITESLPKGHNSKITSVALYYVFNLQKLMRNVIGTTSVIEKFDFLPHFKYAPILSFERGRSQQGLFYYQLYLNYSESWSQFSLLSHQRMWADEIIVIKNKKDILKELDFIGINNKTVYGDFDNIARYIKEKYKDRPIG